MKRVDIFGENQIIRSPNGKRYKCGSCGGRYMKCSECSKLAIRPFTRWCAGEIEVVLQDGLVNGGLIQRDILCYNIQRCSSKKEYIVAACEILKYAILFDIGMKEFGIKEL